MGERERAARNLLRPSLAIIAALVGCTACGGGAPAEPPEPLALEERLVASEDIEGFVASPPTRVRDAGAAAGTLGSAERVDSVELASRLSRAGFVEGMSALLLPEEDPADPALPHGFSFALRLASPERAAETLAWFHEVLTAPCPECELEATEVPVPTIPDGHGIAFARAQEEEEPRGYWIVFADGPFLYVVSAGGEAGAVGGADVVDAADAVYGRVAGRPPAESA